MNDNEKFMSLWSKQRAIGKTRFILTCGVMGWGSTCALLMILLFSIFTTKDDSFREFIVLMSILFSLGGLLWGWLVFSLNEVRYRQLTNDQTGQSTPPPSQTKPEAGAR